MVEEDRGIRDVMVFHGEDKIFYRGGNDETRSLPFSVEETLKLARRALNNTEYERVKEFTAHRRRRSRRTHRS